ncbi:hypothetical protein GCM10018966_063720 [Streptomyces yanii]
MPTDVQRADPVLAQQVRPTAQASGKHAAPRKQVVMEILSRRGADRGRRYRSVRRRSTAGRPVYAGINARRTAA